MGRKKLDKVTVSFICSPKVCEILTSVDNKNCNRSKVVNEALKAAITNDHKIEEGYQLPSLSPRMSVSLDREVNVWLDKHTKLTVGKSNFINTAIESYSCK